MRRSDAVYASSFHYAEIARSNYQMAAGAIGVIPCGMSLAELPLAAAESGNGNSVDSAKRLVVLSVGNSPARKGARVFIEAASTEQCQNVQFVLVCSDARFVASLRVPANVVVLPHQPRAAFQRLLAAAAIVVVPSTFESFSIVAHEAMLLGSGVIVSAHVPLDSPAREYPGLTVLDAVNAPALIAAIAEMLARPPATPAAITATRRQLESAYGMDSVVDRTIAMYRAAGERRRVNTDHMTAGRPSS